MRILIVGLNYAPEPIGIGPYTTGLAQFLAGRGHQVQVVAGRPYYPQWRVHDGYRRLAWRAAVECGVRIVRCPHYVPARPTGLRRIVHHLSFAAAALPVAVAQAVRWRPDVVLCVTPSLASAAVARLAAILGRSRMWLHVQDFEVDAALSTGLVKAGVLPRVMLAAERWLLRAADVVSTISPQMVARLIDKGIAPARTYEMRNWADPAVSAADGGRGDGAVVVIPNAVPPASSPPIAQAAPGPSLLYVGRIHPKKNLAALVQGFAGVAADDPTIRLDIAGWGEAGDVAALRLQIGALPPAVQARVRFHGPVYGADKIGLLASARAVVLPSLSEGLPMAVLEAWAAGVPTVMTPACNLPEGFSAGAAIECGHSPPAIAGGLRRLLRLDPPAWRAMSAAARALQQSRFSADVVAAAWERAYCGLMGDGRPGA